VRAPYKRTRIWINPAFQFRVLARIGYYFLVYVVVVWLLGFFMEVLRSFYTNGVGRSPAQVAIDFLWQQRPLLIAIVAVTPFFIYDLIKFSHRIAGPLHRCRNMMRDMAAGKAVPEFKPRAHDLMPELFEDFNALVKAWNARLAAANGQTAGANGLAATAVEPQAAASQGSAPSSGG
jgi:hypothetical protein